MIAKKDLIDGALYRGLHRCCKFAVWHEAFNRFVYLGFTMGQYGADDAAHPEDDDGHALFVPFDRIELKFTDEECIEAGKVNATKKEKA